MEYFKMVALRAYEQMDNTSDGIERRLGFQYKHVVFYIFWAKKA